MRRSKNRAVVFATSACISALVLSGVPRVTAWAAQTSTTTAPASGSPIVSKSPTTTIPLWDATPKDPKNPIPAPPPPSLTKPAGFDEKLSKIVEAATTPTERVYANPDGSRTAKISTSPQRFKDSSGLWVDYDLSIVSRTDSSLGAKAAPKAATLNTRADGSVATVQTEAGPVVLRHRDINPVAATLDKHEATYPGALSAGRDLKIALTSDGFEESVVVPNAKAPASYSEELVLPAGASVRQTAHGVELVDKTGKAIASYGNGFAYDGDFPRGAVPTPVSVRLLSQNVNVATLEVAIADPTWIGTPGRTFPVTIDPTFSQIGTAPGPDDSLATMVIAGTPSDGGPYNTAYYGSVSLGAGLYTLGNTYRTLLRFDMTPIPANAVVSYAQLAMYNGYTGKSPPSCATKTVDAYALAGHFNEATTWNTQPTVTGAPVTSPPFAHQGWPNGSGAYCPSDWQGLPVTPIVQNWVNGGTNYGVEVRAAEWDMSSFQQFWSAHAFSGANQPYLQVWYDRLPNPATNVVATANADGTATVNWTLATVPPGGSAIDRYVVLALNPGDLSYAGQFAEVCATCTAATLTNLVRGQSYVLGVYPHNAAGYTLSPSNPIVIPPETAATTVAGGLDHNLSVRSDKTVYAWGRNQSGQLGNGFTAAEGIGSGIVPNLGGIVSVAAGDRHSLALKDDGTVWAWGSNQAGELGNADAGIDKPTPVPVVNLAGISAIAAGCDHSLALGSDGSVWAWGNNGFGQLGLGSEYPFSQVWAHVPGITSIKAIAAGCTFSVALKNDGTVWTWGDNSSGQLGDGTTISGRTPRKASVLSGITSVVAGRDHALAISSSGVLKSWGKNSSGQLGDGTTADRPTPVSVQSLSGVIAVAAGTAHSAAVLTGGATWGWGANYRHQLGNNTTALSTSPIQVRKDTAGSPLTGMLPAIAGGGDHTFGISTQLVIFEWGDHGNGQDCNIATPHPAPDTARGPGPSIAPPPVPPKSECDGQNLTLPGVYGERDHLGRPQSAFRTINAASLRTGKYQQVNFAPIGLDSVHNIRGHLLGNQFNGSSTDRGNIVAILSTTNNPGMENFENAVRNRVQKDCEVIDYTVTASYSAGNCIVTSERDAFGKPVAGSGPDCVPRTITITAIGNKGAPINSGPIPNY